MKMTRILSGIILVAITFTFCACSSDSDGSKNNETSNIVETTVSDQKAPAISELYREREDNLPELNFGGETIRFLTLKNRDMTGEVYNDEIWVEELTSDPLKDSIYNRNMYVMERFNCKIVDELASASTVSSTIEKHFNADDDVYQIIGYEAAESLAKSLDGYFCDLNNLDTDYIEFDAPWWSGQFFESIAADDRVYVLAGSLSLSMIRSIHATFFNKRIAEDEGVEDLYNVVNEGRWTIDYQTELVSNMYRDLDGSTTKNIGDRFGYATSFYWAVDSYWSAFNLTILSFDDDGRFEFSLNEEKAYDGFQKIYNLSYGDGAHGENIDDSDVERMFASGETFMITQKLACAETVTFRNMQDDYGIIPMPKFDKKQEEYYSMPYEIFQTYMIPKTCRNTGMASAILEALSAETWRKIIPTYSEIVLKGKYLSDPQSRKMFDMIINNTKIDAGLMYYRRIGEIGSHLYRFPIERNQPENFASNLEKIKRKMPMYVKLLNESVFDD